MADVCYRDPDLLNWLQCAYSLIEMKTFLGESIAESEVKKFHASLFTKLWESWCTGSCQTAKGVNCLPKPCAACKCAVEAIENSHNNKRALCEAWTNCNWPELQTEGGSCQLAKLYMPSGIKKEVNDLKNIDATGIFNLCRNFKPLHQVCKKLKHIGDIIKIRNNIMHSRNLKVEKAVKEQMIETMMKFLDDMQMPGETKIIGEKLKMTKDTVLVISTETQMEQAVNAVQRKLNSIEERISLLEEENSDNAVMKEALQQELEAVKNVAKNSPMLKESWSGVLDKADSLSTLLVRILEKIAKHDKDIAQNRDDIAQNREETAHHGKEIAAIKEELEAGKKGPVVDRHGDHASGAAKYGATQGSNVNVLNISHASNFQIGNTYNFCHNYGNSGPPMSSHKTAKTRKVEKSKGPKRDGDGD